MAAVLFDGAPNTDKRAMVDRVLAYVLRSYEGEVGERSLRAWATAAVDDVWGDGPRVTKYVPMLAIREVRARVIASLEARLAAGAALRAEAARDLWVWRTDLVGELLASAVGLAADASRQRARDVLKVESDVVLLAQRDRMLV